MAVTRYSDIFAPLVEEAIRSLGILEEFIYDFSFNLLPTPQGPAPAIFLIVGIKDPAKIGEWMTAGTVIPGTTANQAMLVTAARQLVNGLLDGRTEALKSTAPSAPSSNSGLIVP